MLARIPDRDERRRIGRRIRRRRLFLGLTQSALAGALGVSFQQVQKYEKGVSRLPPKRLHQIAHAMEVTPDYFSSPNAGQADEFERFVQSPAGIAVYRAMAVIADPAVRDRLILAIAAFSDGIARPEEGEATLLSHWLRRIASQSESERHRKMVGAGIRAMKVELAQLIGKTLKARKLTQKFAARILVTDQARISALARGNVEAASFEKLMRYLVLLGWNARIAIARRPLHTRGKIELISSNEP
ncbi:MAG TPA: helix-turn-helix transcriptional regulator [Rhizomicrobium sp.]|jgi:transcriptional regulator with XRE-family HTH domain|nr:helix-turn-helix transcriptional regulator [Rhizomicrobium sp.]